MHSVASVGPETPLKASHSGHVCQACYKRAHEARGGAGGQAKRKPPPDDDIADTPPKKRRSPGSGIASSLRAKPDSKRARRAEALADVKASVERSKKGEEERPVVLSFADAVRYFLCIRHGAVSREAPLCDKRLTVAAARTCRGGGTDLKLDCTTCDASFEARSLRPGQVEGRGGPSAVEWWKGPVVDMLLEGLSHEQVEAALVDHPFDDGPSLRTVNRYAKAIWRSCEVTGTAAMAEAVTCRDS